MTKMSSENPLERVNYFHGQILTADDFQAEQEYCLARFRRHNRYLHGWGTVCGLEVSVVDLSEIIVQPGLAIDCAGNEIYVDAPVKMVIPQAGRVQFVVLQYEETQSAPAPVVSAGAGTPERGKRLSAGSWRVFTWLSMTTIQPHAMAAKGQEHRVVDACIQFALLAYEEVPNVGESSDAGAAVAG
jgi:hypothetical protein